jgi:hypothetical protein
MTTPVVASAATSTTTGAVLVDRQLIANLAAVGAIRPKTLMQARDILAAISAEAKAIEATSAGVSVYNAKDTPAASTVPLSSAVAGKMTDEQLLKHYVELQGAERRAFFAIHGTRIWNAHERACRSRRARS